MSRERTPPEAGIEGCEACDETANEWVYCTGRAGCVRAKEISGADVKTASTDGGADTAALVAILSSFDDGALPRIMRSYAQEAADALVAKDAEIARLRAENARLMAIVTDDNGPWRLEAAKKRITELEDRHADLAARAADLTLKAQAVAKVDRAALAQRVAEAVRCGALLVVDLRDRARIRAMDLGPIVATALKDSAP